jgi:hypothetical protein
MTAAQLLLRLTGAATLAAGALLFGAGTATLSTLPIGAANTVLTSSGAAPQWSTSLSLTGLTVVDSGLLIVGSASANRTLKFEVDAQLANADFTFNTGAQTADRSLTVPVLTADATLAVLSETQTFTGAKTFDANVTIGSSYSLTVGSLTSGRIPYTTTGGRLIDGFNLTYTSDNLTVGSTASAAASIVMAYGAAGTRQQMMVHVSGIDLAVFSLNDSGASYLGIPTGSCGLASQNAFPIYFCVGGVAKAFFNSTSLTLGDTINLVVGTTTGTKIGTATTQKLGFFNATPIVQLASTTDLRVGLINLGFLATGGATPLDLNGGLLTAARAVLTTGTITTSQPAIDATQTWNAGGVVFTALKLNVTDTASAADSLLIDLSVNGTTAFKVSKEGTITQTMVSPNTASPEEQFIVSLSSTGTPANGFGMYHSYGMESSTTNSVTAGGWTLTWADATHASRRSRMKWTVEDFGGSRECLRLEASGTAAQIGFLGATAVARVTFAAWTGTPTRTTKATSTATLANCAEAIMAIIEDLRAFGLYG